MDLALALGEPSVTRMLETMTDRDLDGWVAYAKKNALPHKRLELYLAQVAQVQGGGKLDAYLLRPAGNEEQEQEGTIEDFAQAGGTGAVWATRRKG